VVEIRQVEVILIRVILGDQSMKRTAAAWAAILLTLAVIVVAGLALFAWYISGYNKAVALSQGAKEAWSNVDTALQRRLDLVPNLVETVKGYAKHEKEIFENIAAARTKYFQADTPAAKMAAANDLSGLLSRLLLLKEAYPELKANQNFLALQDQLEGTENRINVARTRYNEAAKALNTYAKEFFGSFFCRRAGVQPVEYFEASPAAAEPPKVAF
jgi:LemA protein